MWHRELVYTPTANPACQPQDRTFLFIFDPLAPNDLLRLNAVIPSDIMCAGMSWDPQGRLLVVGGNRALPAFLNNAYLIDPATLAAPRGGGCQLRVYGRGFMQLPDMLRSRFYPTIIALTKGVIQFNAASTLCSTINAGAHLVLGGPYAAVPTYAGVDVMEVLPYGSLQWACALAPLFPPSTTQRIDAYDLQVHPNDLSTNGLNGNLDSYPRAFQLSNGDILVVHDVDTPDSFQQVANPPQEAYVIRLNQSGSYKTEFWRVREDATHLGPNADRNYGPAVLMHTLQDNDRVLVFGGTPGAANPASTVQEFIPAQAAATGGTTVEGEFKDKANLLVPRDFTDALVLPDRQILLMGGARQFIPSLIPVADPELYDPGPSRNSVGSSVLMPAGNIVNDAQGVPIGPTQRLYHQFSVLLADGSVYVAGGESLPNPVSGFAAGPYSGEIFLPAYMPQNTGYDMPYIGSVVSAQPMSSTSQPQSFTVTVENFSSDSFAISGVVLTRPGAVTHFFDNYQRYIELPIDSQSVDALTATLTVRSLEDNLGPPGWYMLWVIVTKLGHTQRLPTHAQFVRFY